MDGKDERKRRGRKTKNITLSVDESVLSEVRRYAASRDTTVNALVREFLTSTVAREDRVARARKELLELIDQADGTMGPIVWNRDDIYDR